MRDESFSHTLLKKADTYYEFSQRDFINKPLMLRGFDSAAEYYGINLQNFIADFRRPVTVNCIVIRDDIHLEQTIRPFNLELYNNDRRVGVLRGHSVGRKRILTFPATIITSFRVNLEDAKGNDNISGVAAYLINENLIENEK